ncbi:protein ALP1-like [Myzus persicae]|uniref:protein ALP1-like n=1 Tax=Myzus persicae TaxID=13164 RepID=UPI000B930387|nr:protein ALP1-like [Myzus persicae]
MAVVDSEYCFVVIDVGAYGREGDSTVFKESPFGQKLYSEELDLPTPVYLPNATDSPQPFVFVADEAFGLHKNLLRPFPGRGLTERRRTFNYRLSRARRLVECAFGILANKWRVLHTAILVQPEFTDDIIKACCILHNFVRRRDGYKFEDTLSNNLDEFQMNGTAGARQEGIIVREYFADYFVNAGSIHFQQRYM